MSTPSLPPAASVRELIPVFEAAQSNLDAADGVLNAKTEKLNTAKSEFSSAVVADNDAVSNYNSLADQIAAAILASKREPIVTGV